MLLNPSAAAEGRMVARECLRDYEVDDLVPLCRVEGGVAVARHPDLDTPDRRRPFAGQTR